jgi:hypothetical protein
VEEGVVGEGVVGEGVVGEGVGVVMWELWGGVMMWMK